MPVILSAAAPETEVVEDGITKMVCRCTAEADQIQSMINLMVGAELYNGATNGVEKSKRINDEQCTTAKSFNF